jgi:ribosomal-protein-alanine N-acetyltransferase
VGLVALSEIDLVDRVAMVWYALGKAELSGRGIATAAVRQLTDVAFGEMALASVYAWVMEGNVASRRVLEKVGFREAGRLRQASLHGRQQVDRLYFDLVPADRAE